MNQIRSYFSFLSLFRRRTRIIVGRIFCFLLINIAAISAQSIPNSGDLLSLYTPALLAGGRHVTSTGTIAAHALNPALTAVDERINFDLGYIALIPLGNENREDFGHSFNVGVTIPTSIGIWGLSGHYFGSDISEPSELIFGPMGIINISLAKELYRDIYLGVGLGFQVGNHVNQTGSNDFNIGADIDMGLFHRVGDLGPVQDLSWGFSLRGVGFGFAEPDGHEVYDPLFTPAVGVSLYPFSNENTSLKAKLDIWAPTVAALKAELGVAIRIKKFLQIEAHYPFNIIGGDEVGKNGPGFGLNLNFSFSLPETMKLIGFGEQDWSRGGVDFHSAVSLIRPGIIGVGLGANVALGTIDEDPPYISIKTANIEYRSPNLDGIQDDLLLPITITDSSLIAGYVLVIEDSNKNVIRKIYNKDWRPESYGVQDALDRLLTVKEGIVIPESLRWDGRSSEGNVVANGSYQYYLEAWDGHGNHSHSDPRTVIVDNTPPKGSVRVIDYLFSPNDDGNKDHLVIQQQLSEQDFWQAHILDSTGIAVAEFNWDKIVPIKTVWDGRQNDGSLVNDGIYSYHLVGLDRAGNRTEIRVPNIIVNTQATPISLRVSDAEISPNGDEEDDATTYNISVPVLSGILEWMLVIRNSDERLVRQYTGSLEIPKELVFDGRDNSGNLLPEGSYSARLDVSYENGNHPYAESPDVLIDVTVPTATIKASLPIFSPDGDGNKDFVTIFHETYDEAVWTAILQTDDDSVIRTNTWHGVPADSFDWNGRRSDGFPATDGTYHYTLKARDSAGNVGQSNTIAIRLDTAETPVLITSNYSHFSPNSDGLKDQILLFPKLEDVSGIEHYALKIYAISDHEQAKLIRAFEGSGNVPSESVWDGLNKDGNQVADGEYFASLEVLYSKGNRPEARTSPFFVDTVYPRAELTADYLLISPDGDGLRDEIYVEQSSSSEETWVGEIIDHTGSVIRNYFWRGQLTSLTWDSRDENGNIVPDGNYDYRVTGQDLAGNTSTALLTGIQIDARPTPLFVTLVAEGFSPNSDGVRDTQGIGTVVGLNEGISTWEVEFSHVEKGLQRQMGGSKDLPERIVWDGLTDEGSTAPEGPYFAEVMLTYLKGNQPLERTSIFHLDYTAPLINMNLFPQPFSPDNDGIDDELFMEIEIDDINPISGWSMTIIDPQGSLFTTFSGRGTPGKRIIWDGVSDTGELVQSALDYPVAMAASDSLGNTALVHSMIPVDVLVIRDGDKLKIRIASITFPPNSADLSQVFGDAADKNARTLARLGQIFTKNRTYTIQIEGHANSVLFANKEAADREQRDVLLPLSAARAKAVKRELMALGVSEARITTEGLGGSSPVVEFSDKQNRWKNRRVEFILTGRGL